ncbi:MAG: hypothetical protein OEQ47_18465, partial [Acidimicrobiia bacterium]|nr:hypothetical protein [Acidimicrobiia bacterium]
MTRLVDAATVERYLTPEMAFEAMERCFALEAAGETGPVSRTDLTHSEGWMRVLPAVFEGLGVFGHKVISFNRGIGVRYVVSMFDVESGDLRAIVDAEAITGFRTGATAALAASRICREGVRVAAIVGTGSVARNQLPALQLVRMVPEIRVFSRNPDNRKDFIDQMRSVVSADLVEAGSVDEAIEGAGIVSLATKSPEPVFSARHLAAGMHVSSVGSARPSLSELEPDTFARFDRVVCDSVELVFSESGDAIAAASSGLYDSSNAVDLASIVGEPGPGDPDSTTLFKS